MNLPFVPRSTYQAKLDECNDLRAEIASLKRELAAFDTDTRVMADTIRNADQLIFQMSQCTTWESMRPLFNKLQVGQSSRQRAESNRITDILRTELISVYTKPTTKP